MPVYSTVGLIRFGEDGTTVFDRSLYTDPQSGQQQGSMMRLDLATGKVVWQVSGADYGFGQCASFALSAKANQLWCGNYFGRVREWSLATGARTGRELQNQKGWATDLDLISTPGGTMLAAVSNNDGVISRWMVDGGGPIQRVVAPDRRIFGIFPDGKTLLVGTRNGRPDPFSFDEALWDVATDKEVPGLPAMIYGGVVGNTVSGTFADFTIGTYDLTTKERTRMPIKLNPVPTAAMGSNDGKILLLGYGDGHVDEYDNTTGAHLQRVQMPPFLDGSNTVGSVAISNDHRHIYAAGNGLVSFEAATAEMTARNGDLAIAYVGVGPGGDVVATSVDGTIGSYDARTLAKTASLPGARGLIQNFFFSADGKTLVGAGNDGSVSVYDLASHTRIGDAIDMDRNDGAATALRADGGMLAIETPHDDGVELWDLDPSHWVDAACSIAGRNLTREEWTTYIGDLGPYEATCPQYPTPT